MTVVGGHLSPLDYHRGSRHDFGRFAPSLGYLDWANQPDAFRRFSGAPVLELPRAAAPAKTPYHDLFGPGGTPAPLSLQTLAEFLRCSLGLSAWKAYGAARWALRVNPSSGNLHPTEGYILWNGKVFHYAPAEHALEERAVLPDEGPDAFRGDADRFLVGLTSIHWREAWKYGERAFRYCQHDVGHALGALRLAAAMLGWRLAIAPAWSHADTASLLGIDRDEDFEGAEREEPALVAVVTANASDAPFPDPRALTAAARRAQWCGHANRLSATRVPWPHIEQVAHATAYRGFASESGLPRPVPAAGRDASSLGARQIILQRRSATGFDPRGMLRRETFLGMLRRLVPAGPPWDVRPWVPPVHLVLFVHRVQDMVPGIYVFVRHDDGTMDGWRGAMRPDLLWERVAGEEEGNHAGLFLLAPLDVRRVAARLSCDQDIAGDGFFSLGMLADLSSLDRFGDWFYRALFWECGLIGQVLYLEAEAAGARGTGIGCFYDDPVRETLGLHAERWQSLYHFSMGLPLDDARLTTEPGYAWEAIG